MNALRPIFRVLGDADVQRLIVAVGGLALVGAGVGMIFMPAGLIVTGVLLLAGAVAGSLRSRG